MHKSPTKYPGFPSPEKIEAIRYFKRPKNVKSLRRFTGIGSVLCSINTKFIS